MLGVSLLARRNIAAEGRVKTCTRTSTQALISLHSSTGHPTVRSSSNGSHVGRADGIVARQEHRRASASQSICVVVWRALDCARCCSPTSSSFAAGKARCDDREKRHDALIQISSVSRSSAQMRIAYIHNGLDDCDNGVHNGHEALQTRSQHC